MERALCENGAFLCLHNQKLIRLSGKAHGMTKITELEDEEWHRIIGINLTGLMYCLRAELHKISDGGSIVNISSIQGVMGVFPLLHTALHF